MPIIQGGIVMPGSRQPIYAVNGVPTDANVGISSPPNGTLAQNTANGNIYERQAGVWVRIDTL
jgi:hypothetical protein